MDAKKHLVEILDFYKQKVLTDGCTMDEINSATKALEQNMNLFGTISSFAKFYDVPENQIRATISRKLFAKPKRVLLYPFHKFSAIVPEKWKDRL